MTEKTDLEDLNGRPLGEYLVAAGVVSPVVIDYALHKQKIEGAPLGKLLVELGFTSSKDIARYLASQRQIPFVDLADLPAPSQGELDMLDNVAAERRPTSRLACQLKATAALQGLVLHLPETQE